jgi:CheY-like chemotaxis protein/HPt (histidine-containing phosphotransfer) domain-containing protein
VRRSDLHSCLSAVLGTEIADIANAELVTRHSLIEAEMKFEGRVLLTEDNPVNQQVAMGMLRKLGLRVSLANNGKEALEIINHARFDLVLMDCQMPVMDGYEATAAIRKLEREALSKAKLPIIALTANALPGDREKCLAAGMDDYLSKPFMLGQLKAVLERWLPNQADKSEYESETLAVEPMKKTADEKANESDAEAHTTEGLERVIDKKVLDGIRSLEMAGAPDMLTQVIQIYLKDTPKLLEQITQADAAGDAPGVQRAAHSLKSSSANLGALQLSAFCKSLEASAREANLKEFPRLFAQIKTEYSRVEKALALEIQGGE